MGRKHEPIVKEEYPPSEQKMDWDDVDVII
jgi:hypothetical protein